tara:strand:+ start:22937 stop:24499 length:1563 start_codon:yes stop_codon:yes gene_type:complete
MTKNYLLTLLFLFSLFSLTAQNKDSDIILLNEQFELKSKKQIPVKIYQSADRIDNFHLHEDLITFQIRGKRNNGNMKDLGVVNQYHLKKDSILWKMKISYKFEEILQEGSLIIHYTAESNKVIDHLSGEKVWWVKHNLISIDSLNLIGFGYKSEEFPSNFNFLEGVDLKNGRVLWQREVNRQYGINNIQQVNDSNFLIASAGLHQVNIFNGEGWDYNAIFGGGTSNNGVGTAVAGAIMFGLVGGIIFYQVAIINNSINSENRSNLIQDSSSIFYTSKDYLAKLEKDGSPIWQYILSSKDLQQSEIVKYKNHLLFIHSGYIINEKNRKTLRGKPYLVVFDETTGKKLFQSDFETGTFDFISDYTIKEDQLTLLLPYEVVKIDLNKLEVLAKVKISENYKEKLQNLLIDDNYIKLDSMLIEINEKTDSNFYVSDESKNIWKVKKDLESIEKLSEAILYTAYLKSKNYRLIRSEKDAFLLDPKNQVLAEFPYFEKAIINNGKLLISIENQLLELKLTDLLTKD